MPSIGKRIGMSMRKGIRETMMIHLQGKDWYKTGLADARVHLGAHDPQVLEGHVQDDQGSFLISLYLDLSWARLHDKTAGRSLFWLESGGDFHLRYDISRNFGGFLKATTEFFCQNHIRRKYGIGQKDGISFDIHRFRPFLAGHLSGVYRLSFIKKTLDILCHTADPSLEQISFGDKTFIQADNQSLDLDGNGLGHPPPHRQGETQVIFFP